MFSHCCCSTLLPFLNPFILFIVPHSEGVWTARDTRGLFSHCCKQVLSMTLKGACVITRLNTLTNVWYSSVCRASSYVCDTKSSTYTSVLCHFFWPLCTSPVSTPADWTAQLQSALGLAAAPAVNWVASKHGHIRVAYCCAVSAMSYRTVSC